MTLKKPPHGLPRSFRATQAHTRAVSVAAPASSEEAELSLGVGE